MYLAYNFFTPGEARYIDSPVITSIDVTLINHAWKSKKNPVSYRLKPRRTRDASPK